MKTTCIPKHIALTVTEILKPYKAITPDQLETLFSDGVNHNTETTQLKRALTPKEACSYLHISLMTLWKWRKKGIVQSIKPSGKKVLILRESIESILQAKQQ